MRKRDWFIGAILLVITVIGIIVVLERLRLRDIDTFCSIPSDATVGEIQERLGPALEILEGMDAQAGLSRFQLDVDGSRVSSLLRYSGRYSLTYAYYLLDSNGALRRIIVIDGDSGGVIVDLKLPPATQP